MDKNKKYFFETIEDTLGNKVTIQVVPEIDRPKNFLSVEELIS